MIAAALIAVALGGAAPATGSVAIWRLDCGSFDVKSYEDLGPRKLSNGCYLLKHDGSYMLWDAGLDAGLIGHPDVSPDATVALDEALEPQLARLGVDPASVEILAISHCHGDHLGQAGIFTKAKLLIGDEDIPCMTETVGGAAAFPWLNGERTLDKVSGDRDIYGDGSVVMLSTPGHTPGHHSLLVRLADRTVILTGDAVHQRDQLESGKMPGNGTDLVAAAASAKRLLKIAKRENATIIVQHDERDDPALPSGPGKQ
jgi:N-acyl homoserine lactone hydrolase